MYSIDSYGAIYKLTDPTGKIYIGSTAKGGDLKAVELRFSEHVKDSKKYPNSTRKLLNSISKYGPQNIKRELLETVFMPNGDDTNLRLREQELINQYRAVQNGLNSSYSTGGTYYYKRFEPVVPIARFNLCMSEMYLFENLEKAAMDALQRSMPGVIPNSEQISRAKTIIKRNLFGKTSYAYDSHYAFVSEIKNINGIEVVCLDVSSKCSKDMELNYDSCRENVSGNYSLSIEQEQEIANRYINGEFRAETLGKEYGVTYNCVQRILEDHNIKMVPFGYNPVACITPQGEVKVFKNNTELAKFIHAQLNLSNDPKKIYNTAANIGSCLTGKTSRVKSYYPMALAPDLAVDPIYTGKKCPMIHVIPNPNGSIPNWDTAGGTLPTFNKVNKDYIIRFDMSSGQVKGKYNNANQAAILLMQEQRRTGDMVREGIASHIRHCLSNPLKYSYKGDRYMYEKAYGQYIRNLRNYG